MSHFNDVMRIGRKYRTEVNKLKSKYNQTIAKEADKEGSKYYDSFLENQNADYSAKKKELVLQAKKNVSEQIKTMRENRNNHISQSPTNEDVATLQCLNMLERVSPDEFMLYVKPMANRPLSMRVASQIAEKNNISLYIPTIEESDRALDVLEYNANRFIDIYDGEDSIQTNPVLINIEGYFRPEDGYLDYTDVKSSKKSDQIFWNEVIQVSSPETFEADGDMSNSISAKFHFQDIDHMLDYMNKLTEGMTDDVKEDTVNAILAQCPDSYGIAYRYYKGRGKKMPLKDDGETFSVDEIE